MNQADGLVKRCCRSAETVFFVKNALFLQFLSLEKLGFISFSVHLIYLVQLEYRFKV